jgi:hypothetical protein
MGFTYQVSRNAIIHDCIQKTPFIQSNTIPPPEENVKVVSLPISTGKSRVRVITNPAGNEQVKIKVATLATNVKPRKYISKWNYDIEGVEAINNIQHGAKVRINTDTVPFRRSAMGEAAAPDNVAVEPVSAESPPDSPTGSPSGSPSGSPLGLLTGSPSGPLTGSPSGPLTGSPFGSPSGSPPPLSLTPMPSAPTILSTNWSTLRTELICSANLLQEYKRDLKRPPKNKKIVHNIMFDRAQALINDVEYSLNDKIFMSSVGTQTIIELKKGVYKIRNLAKTSFANYPLSDAKGIFISSFGFILVEMK